MHSIMSVTNKLPLSSCKGKWLTQGPPEDVGGGDSAGAVAGRRRGALWSCAEAVRRPLARGLNMHTRNVYIAGAELGGWAFTANAIMVRLRLVWEA